MRKQRQGFMKCWNSTHHTVSQKKEKKNHCYVERKNEK